MKAYACHTLLILKVALIGFSSLHLKLESQICSPIGKSEFVT